MSLRRETHKRLHFGEAGLETILAGFECRAPQPLRSYTESGFRSFAN
jgi:hypothetical protein